MANSYFQFKQFTIQQQNVAMKVGTDGVLLGSWCKIKGKNALDIGAGTGLIGIMLTQRNPSLNVTAIEIDKQACVTAQINFNNSPWTDNLNLVNSDFIDLAKTCSTKFDTIVSNPPFFVNSLHNTDKALAKARHSESLSFNELITSAASLLSAQGVFSVIIPSSRFDEFKDLASENGLFVNKLLHIKPTPSKEPKRVLIQLSFIKTDIRQDTLIVEIGGRHCYSLDYKELTSDFYLKF